ncbi:MAG: hypothetical protein QW231_05265 [Candidatus Bathyarchaeia archaeon]
MVKVKILAGSRSIGGNFIRIEDRDRILIFDQGIRFDVMANYYSGSVMPQGIAELRELGVVPKPEWYEGANAIYISHMHLDHLGVLSNIPLEAKVFLPNLATYEIMEERWRLSPTWTAMVPRKYYVGLEEFKPLETDEHNVMAIPVSHSAHDAFALLYFGSDETILYTGDFRTEGFLNQEEFVELRGGEDLLSYLRGNPDLKVDIFITEGTNVGSSRVPLTPRDGMAIIKRIASHDRPVMATIHSLDMGYAYALMKLASELGIRYYVASTQVARLMEGIPKLPLNPILLEEYVDFPSLAEKVPLEDLERDSMILVSYNEVVELLKSLASIHRLPKDAVAIMSEPEPEIEEASEYGVVANWFSKIGVQHYRVRVSGHYYPFEIRELQKVFKPKRIVPIHTVNPEMTKNLWMSITERTYPSK